jgi:hypothetical protein
MLELVHDYETTLDHIQEYLADEHRIPHAGDRLGGFMDWGRFFGPQARILAIMDTGIIQDQRSSDLGQDVQFRHLLYSVIDPRDPRDRLIWITLRSVQNTMSLITANGAPYFMFRALVTGYWRNSHGMHISISTTDPRPDRHDYAWFRRNMRRYAAEWIHEFSVNVVAWTQHIRDRIQTSPPRPNIPPVLLDPRRRLPPSAAKNTNPQVHE